MEGSSLTGGLAGTAGTGGVVWGRAEVETGLETGPAGCGGSLVFCFVTMITINFFSSIPWSFKILLSSNILPKKLSLSTNRVHFYSISYKQLSLQLLSHFN